MRDELLFQKYQRELEEHRTALQRCAESNSRQIEELSRRVESLEEQLGIATNVAEALNTEVRWAGDQLIESPYQILAPVLTRGKYWLFTSCLLVHSPGAAFYCSFP